MTTPCFWVERTGEAEIHLRRFVLTDTPGHYHSADVRIGRQPIRWADEGRGTILGSIDDTVADDEPRWPTACDCGYVFSGDDERQINQEPLYRAADGREWASRNLPPGAMLDARWQPDDWKGPDGMAVTVVLPEGPYVEGETDTRGWWWNIDGPASDGEKLTPHAWTRTGDPKAEPPTVSASPSINAVGRYHGFLTNGELTDNIG